MLFPNLAELIALRSSAKHVDLMVSKNYSQSAGGNYTSIFRGLGVEFETVRPYVVGDDVRYIDWRVTARTGKAHIKTFRAESDRHIIMVMDVNNYMRFGTRKTFKSIQAAQIGAFLLWHGLQQQDRVGGILCGDISGGTVYHQATKHVHGVLQILKDLCIQDTGIHAEVPIHHGLECAVRLAVTNSLVFVIADFSFDNRDLFAQQLLRLRCKCKVVLIAVHDPADAMIPQIGAFGFAYAGQEAVVDTNDKKAHVLYQQEWQSYCRWLDQLGKKYKIPVLWLDTTQDAARYGVHMIGALQAWKS